jgi:MYXO-CTERM domain-containing protein
MVTRLVMRISPAEMDRDPVFAYNATLPSVQPERPIRTNTVCLDGWTNGPYASRVTLDGLGSWVFSGPNTTDPRFAKAPFALKIQLLDETGGPLDIAPPQVELIDTAIAGATPGKPSLPKDLVLQTVAPWSPPPSDILVTQAGPWKQPAPWCKPKAGWVDGKAAPTGPASQADAGSDSGATSGPVPGVDAQGGWTDAVSPQATPAAAKATPPDDGCSSGRASSPWWSPALGLAAVAWLIRRRRA